MRWKIVLIFILLLLAGGFWYWQKHPSYRLQLDDIARSLSQNAAVQDIQKQVVAPEPLRGTQNEPDAYLTVLGVIKETNAQRFENGRSSLKENSLLDQAAQKKLRDMFQNQYFEHISPDGKGPGDLATQVGYEYITVGENLALGNFKDDAALVQAWMDSPGHRANILNPDFSEIGVAVGKGQFEGRAIWLAVQEFGKPSSACPAVNYSLKSQISGYESELKSLESQITDLKAELEAADPKTRKEIEDYNQRVKEYNDLVKLYNNKLDMLKQIIDQYNSEVRAYNACAGA